MTLPDIRIQNTGAAQSNVPFTFGQVFAAGDLMPGEGLAGKLADGSTIPLQVDQKATHGDGSVRHAVISGVLPVLAKGATAKFDLVKASADTGGFARPAPSFSVTITVDGQKYTASQAVQLGVMSWLSGSIVYELYSSAPLLNSAGAEHPLLTARFGVRQYAGGQTRVEVIVENTSTWKTANKLTYDVTVEVAGKAIYSKTALTHYHHSRWHQYAWTGTAPAIHIQHNTAYLIATKAVSNYEQLTIPELAITNLAGLLTSDNVGPMTIGPTTAYMGTTGGRADIGPLPAWSVLYLLSMDERAKKVMMAAADGSGSWSIHYRDDNTGAPLRLDNDVNKNITTHWNALNTGPLPNPWFVDSSTPYEDDVAHQPSLAYLPYILTGDLYYLEELQFWASSNPLKTGPAYRGFDKGLMRWEQVRGQAWSLRTLGHAAYITPDASPMKTYFTKQLDNNLDFYSQTYVIGNPNKLGIYDGSGEFSIPMGYYSPWQDDFLTWSFGYLSELGFAKAEPLFKWKAQAVLGRMNGPGYCWINAAPYTLNYRDKSGNVYGSWADMFLANFGGPGFFNDNSEYYEDPKVKYVDLPCGSQAQADYLGLANNYPARWYTWQIGRMTGGPDQNQGFPSNMQPALSIAATSGLPDAMKAWTTFAGRADQPNYQYSPEWDILPRTVVVAPPVTAPIPPVVTAPVTPPVITPPVVAPVTPPAAKTGKIITPSSTALVAVMKLTKAKQFTYQVFDIQLFNVVKEFKAVAPSTKGVFTLMDVTLYANKKRQLAGKVLDSSGKVLLVHYPLTVV